MVLARDHVDCFDRRDCLVSTGINDAVAELVVGSSDRNNLHPMNSPINEYLNTNMNMNTAYN